MRQCILLLQRLKATDQIKVSDKQILQEADRLDIKDKGPLVLVEVLLDEDIIKQLTTYKKHFLRVSSLCLVLSQNNR